MKNEKRIDARLSVEDVRRLKEIAEPYGGISQWIRAQIQAIGPKPIPAKLPSAPPKPKSNPTVSQGNCPGCGRPTRYCEGTTITCINKKP
jgi:hypothetical protein